MSTGELATKVKAMCENTMPRITEPLVTNFYMLRELRANFQPKELGILSGEEVDYITETLQIKNRTIINLRNLRDMAVMFFSDNMDEYGDLMSGVVAVIDNRIFNLGGEV